MNELCELFQNSIIFYTIENVCSRENDSQLYMKLLTFKIIFKYQNLDITDKTVLDILHFITSKKI